LVNPRFGSWYDNVASWLAMQHNRRFLLLRYEDMLEDPQRELKRVAEFLGLQATPERLARAVRLSSADHMRELEKSQGDQWTLTKDTRPDIAFIRKARAGGWRTELSAQTVAEVEKAWGSLMHTLGYELITSPAEVVK
jgi:aryl sulfotransferase